MGENIGAAARAMANFGLSELRIVSPRDGWPNDKALANAAGALDQGLVSVQVFDDLKQAIADCHFVLGTSARSRDMVKPVYPPREAVSEVQARASGQLCALMFGPERTGLTNDHLVLCHGFIHVPTQPDFASLNLAQCVLLMCYEMSSKFLHPDESQDAELLSANSLVALDPDFHRDANNKDLPATQKNLEEFLSRLEGELEQGGFFKSEGLKPTMLRSIRNMFTRGALSDQEVRTLHGIVSCLVKNQSK